MTQTLSESFDTIQTNFPLWKRQRHQILDCLIKTGFPHYDVFELPANVIRSYERKNIMDVKQSEQEAVLFDNFMILCRWGKNTPYIQCFQGEGNKIIWHWGNVDQTFEKHNQNVCRWMKNCLQLATSLFDIQLILSRLRNDKTRGPTVTTFCSLVLRYLRKNVLNELDKLQIEMERTGAKNLLTLQRLCGDMNVQILKPIKRIAREIEEDNIIGGELVNFLFLKKKSPENYHIVNLMDDIISMAIERYYEVIIEWITECTLSYDLAHEFFIWDLRKQKIVERMEFVCINEINAIELNEQQMGTISFDRAFVRIPQLLPEDFKSISEEIYRLGKYLYIIRQQKGDLDSQCTLDAASFKNLSLGQFCKQINILYKERSQQILEHFKRQYDIINFAKQLPCFFIGLNSPWISEFAELFEENELFQVEFEVLDRKLTGLVQKAFQSAQMQENPYNRYFQLKLSEFTKKEGQLAFLPKAGTYPILELHIACGDAALRQAFPAKILEPYRKMFFHLFLLNRAKYLLHRKYFLRNVVSHELARQECATLFLFIRFLNVYQEYICGIAANAYGELLKKLDSATNLDELVNGQLEFVHKMMEHAKLDQENEELCQWIEALCNEFSLYADGHLNLIELNQKASPIVGKIKKHLLEHKRSLSTLKNLLFGCYFSAIGASANDEPLWKLLQHVDKMPE